MVYLVKKKGRWINDVFTALADKPDLGGAELNARTKSTFVPVSASQFLQRDNDR